jgi:hypothetical protein
MIAYERLVLWVTQHFEGVSDDYRQDVALTASELGADAGLRRRWLELGALLALALRLRSRNQTGGRASAVWHQGFYVGALLLLAMLASVASSRLADPMALAQTSTIAMSLMGAIALAVAFGLGLGGRRSVAVLLAAGGTAACLSAVGRGAGQALFASASVIAVGGLLIGTVPSVPAGRGRVLLASTLPSIGLPIGLIVGSHATVLAATLAFTALAPGGMVAAGWFDPRLAAAATVLVLSRLLASGFDELGRALAVLVREGRGALLLRWVLMCSAVLATWFATHRSIRRLRSP